MSLSLVRLAFVACLGITVAGCTSSAPDTVTSGDRISSASTFAAPAAFAPTDAATVARAKPYFVEFRARSAMSYGHTFAVFGELDQNGRVPTDASGVLIPGMTEITGLHPASTSNVPYTIGHVLPVPSETGPSDGDSENAYMTARYRIDLTEAQYRDLVAFIRKKQSSSPLWHAVLYNCSAYVGDIAEHLGLKTPNPMLFPKDYINELKALNT
ncbi:hypothetical protein [Aurantimonas sp. HBX-1]|uniref:hypothetical protein n=1 Tax=Aurantimonas sp. HBX-1 TaxID=2906072 RepID=UPI001F26DE13|nr:hypothetical protein [Aurantimonas sp. HBX-1]UIJ73953.1 hypothetical protein LXB15_10230 [Aurantimonas sp. HBX-1]